MTINENLFPKAPDPSTTIKATYIDNNFWRISAQTATKLCKPWGLPRHGYERVISFQGCQCMVTRTFVTDNTGTRKQVWALHVTSTPLAPPLTDTDKEETVRPHRL